MCAWMSSAVFSLLKSCWRSAAASSLVASSCLSTSEASAWSFFKSVNASIPVPPLWLCVSCRTLHANRTRKGVIQDEEQTECREMELRLVEYAEWGRSPQRAQRKHRGP